MRNNLIAFSDFDSFMLERPESNYALVRIFGEKDNLKKLTKSVGFKEKFDESLLKSLNLKYSII